MTTCLGKNCFTMRVFRERSCFCVCSSFPLGFEGGMWDLIVLGRDRWFSFYFECQNIAG